MTQQKIHTYNGKKGLRTITEHSLHAENELLIIETSYASLNDMFGEAEGDSIRKKFLEEGIRIKQLTNKAYHEEYTGIKDFHTKVMDIRYIKPQHLDIKVETLIYNNIVGIYDPRGNGICVEIESKEFADQYRQFFESFWKSGERPIIGRNGRTSIF